MPNVPRGFVIQTVGLEEQVLDLMKLLQDDRSILYSQKGERDKDILIEPDCREESWADNSANFHLRRLLRAQVPLLRHNALAIQP